ncbi:AfsR/SARP family transcriptional regulator [Deinococcus hopiensis]|uniref:DNA-binding transcriptional activator of the SARP family n=1 Tax=Deinococcus hopiensis KR-140 TaxID=695939 RepID=A0A1W1U9I1_9DEIO|nr:hypothetical protein [Deinococcus hopiensis]SMB77748.1 hypothetical protein SAMN00790413_03897 [Deinococcus hopiensis KR-140]
MVKLGSERSEEATGDPSGMVLRLLGRPRLQLGESKIALGGGALRVLAVLALDGPQSRAQLADTLWEGTTTQVLQNLRVALTDLRRCLTVQPNLVQEVDASLTLDLSQIHVDVLCPPRDLDALLPFWAEFMVGFRHKGCEAWLEWAEQTEMRLLEAHVQDLLRSAAEHPSKAHTLLERALQLAPDHPEVQSRWAEHVRAPAAPSEEELLRTLEQVTLRLWVTAQAAEVSPDPDARHHRQVLLDGVSARIDTAFIPRLSRELAGAEEALSTYRLRDQVGAEWAARQVLDRQTKGTAAALALDVLANLAMDQGQYQRGRKYAEQALTLVTEPSSEIAFTAASSNVILGHQERAAEIALGALKTLDARDSPAMLYGILARSYDARQRYREARYWHDLALQSAYDQGDPLVLPQVISFMLWHLNITGDPVRSAALAREGLSHGNFSAHLINSLGFSNLIRREYGAVQEVLAPQLRVNNMAMASTAHAATAMALHQMGQSHEAEQVLREARPLLDLTENGSVRYEWAAAALVVNPGEWAEEADRLTKSAQPNDPTLPQWYARLRATKVQD